MPDTIMTTEVQQPRNRSNEIKDLAAALCKAQAAMEGAKKDANNPHFNSKYADLASVWDAVRKPLTDNDLCIVQFPRTAGNGVEIETTLMHGKTGQFMSDVLWVPCSKNDAQGLGSAITYGRRYSLMAVTGIAPEDDDGNAAAASHKPGVPGSAGGGTQFRSERRQQPTGWVKDALNDGLIPNGDTRSRYEQGKEAAAAKAKVGREATPEQARAAKIKSKTDERIAILKNRDGGWTRDTLKQFWDDDAKWRDWMGDPANEALAEFERYTTAYTEAQDALP